MNLQKTVSTIQPLSPKRIQIETEIEPCVIRTESSHMLILATVSFSGDEENLVVKYPQKIVLVMRD